MGGERLPVEPQSAIPESSTTDCVQRPYRIASMTRTPRPLFCRRLDPRTPSLLHLDDRGVEVVRNFFPVRQRGQADRHVGVRCGHGISFGMR
jgi:hypothetical protein